VLTNNIINTFFKKQMYFVLIQVHNRTLLLNEYDENAKKKKLILIIIMKNKMCTCTDRYKHTFSLNLNYAHMLINNKLSI
jgi:hypothetical protein